MGDAIRVCPRQPRKMKYHQIIAVGVMLGAAAVCRAGQLSTLYSAPGSRGTTSNNHGNSNFNKVTTNQHHSNTNFRQTTTTNQHHGNTNFRQTSNSFGGQQQASAGFGGHSGNSGFRATAVAIPVGVVADILATLPQHTNSGNQGNFQGSQGGFQGGFQDNHGGFSGNQAGFNQGFNNNNNGASTNQFRGQHQYSGHFRGSTGFGGQGSSQFQGNSYQQPSQNFVSTNFRGNNGW